MHQIEKTAVGPEKLVSDNKLVFSNCEKYIVLWAGKICWVTCFHHYSPKIRLQKGKKITAALPKGKPNSVLFPLLTLNI